MSSRTPSSLSSISSFAALPISSQHSVANIARLRALRPGQLLWSEGELGEVFSFVLSGHIKLIKQHRDGEERILGLFGPGIVGYAAVARRAPYLASAVALQQVCVLECPWDLWLNLLNEDRALMAATHDALVEHSWYLLNRAHEFSAGGVAHRIATLLLGLLDDLGVRKLRGDSMHDLIPIPLTRQELASLVSARPETVVRQLSRWRSEQIIAIDDAGLWLLDRDALAAL